MKRLILGVAVAAIVATALVHASAAPHWTTDVDRMFQPWNTRTTPGCALGVFQNGEIAYAHGYGMADLEHDVPIAPASVFYVGSLTKQFTAMSAALAIQQGKLGYDDPVRKYLPEMPAYADGIKVSNLIHHTSGLRDYYALLSIAGRRYDSLYDNDAVLKFAARQKQLNFTPGDQYSYSNTGYQLLAVAIERATKTPFAQYGDEQIFTPLMMTVTHFHTDATRIVKDRVIGYGGSAGKWTIDVPDNERAGAGGLYTNIPDLQKWDENFYTAKVGGAELIKKLQTPAHLNDGKAIAYAWGLETGTYRGLEIVEHTGALHGYRAVLTRFPSQHTSIAILCNHSAIVPSRLARNVADIVLRGALKPDPEVSPAPPAQPAPYSGPVTAPGEHAGTYYSEELDTTFAVREERGAVTLQREIGPPLTLTRVGAQSFRAPGFVVRFVDGTLLVDAGIIHGVEFTRR